MNQINPSEVVNNWIQNVKVNPKEIQSKVEKGQSLSFLVKDVLAAFAQVEKLEWFLENAHRIHAMATISNQHRYTGLIGKINELFSKIRNRIKFSEFKSTAQLLLNATKDFPAPALPVPASSRSSASSTSAPASDIPEIPEDEKPLEEPAPSPRPIPNPLIMTILGDDARFGIAQYLNEGSSAKNFKQILLENNRETPKTLDILRALSIAWDFKATKETLFRNLPEIGPHLEDLDVLRFDLSSEELEYIFSCCPNLKIIRSNSVDKFDALIQNKKNMLSKMVKHLPNIGDELKANEYQKEIDALRDKIDQIQGLYNINLLKCMKGNEPGYKPVTYFAAFIIKGLTEIAAIFNHLDEFTFDFDPNITDEVLSQVLINCKKLKKITLNSKNFKLLSHLSLLSPTIREITVHRLDLTPEQVNQLPSGITHLTLSNNGLQNSTTADFLLKFQHLTHLNVISNGHLKDFVHYLPKELKQLNYAFYSYGGYGYQHQTIHELIHFLPKNLEILTLDGHVLSGINLRISALPQSLKTLHLKLEDATLDPKALKWPNQLTDLTIEQSDDKQLNTLMSQLPQTLKALTINGFTSPFDILSLLPSTLEVLKFNYVNMHAYRVEKLELVNKIPREPINLPSSLKTLILPNFMDYWYQKPLPDLSTCINNRDQIKIKMKRLGMNLHSLVFMNTLLKWGEQNKIEFYD